ncbi:MAG: DUF4276 family protein [Elusimicrobia bacterium]|nr:DUF4276 family protein [Elusimicrobiota bacterium]
MHIELLVEESSAEAALNVLLPRILGRKHTFKVYPHQGKTDPLAVLPHRLRAYRAMIQAGWNDCRIAVLLDRDRDACLDLKRRVEAMAIAAGLSTKSKPRRRRFVALSRIAIEELEAWFFGDRQAVVKAYPRLGGKKLRWPPMPDRISGGTWETFERLLQRDGYHKSGYTKVHGARIIAEQMDPQKNTSPSFRCFRDGLLALAAA